MSRARRSHREAGMVTAELAVGLAAVVAVLVLALGALAVVGQQLRCLDAAAVGARIGARGESDAAVVAAASARAPAGSQVAVHRGAGTVEVVVTGPAPGGDLTGLRPVGRSVFPLDGVEPHE